MKNCFSWTKSDKYLKEFEVKKKKILTTTYPWTDPEIKLHNVMLS